MKDLYSKENSFFIRIFNKNKLDIGHKNSLFISKIDDLEEAIKKTIAENKIEKIIFLGAAFLTQSDFFIRMKEDDIDNLLSVNILNYVKITKILLPFMIEKRNGNIVYLSSFRSSVTSRGISLYSASKSFGESFFEVIGKEYGAIGVYSTSIRMGYFDGRMTLDQPKDKLKAIKLNSGNRRLGSSSDLIEAINFVLKNPYTNGGVIDLHGGINHEF